MVRAMFRMRLTSGLALLLLLVVSSPPSARAVARASPPPARAGAPAATVVVNPAAGARLRLNAAQTVGHVARLGLRVVRVAGSPEAAAARLARTRGVRWAEP